MLVRADRRMQGPGDRVTKARAVLGMTALVALLIVDLEVRNTMVQEARRMMALEVRLIRGQVVPVMQDPVGRVIRGLADRARVAQTRVTKNRQRGIRGAATRFQPSSCSTKLRVRELAQFSHKCF